MTKNELMSSLLKELKKLEELSGLISGNNTDEKVPQEVLYQAQNDLYYQVKTATSVIKEAETHLKHKPFGRFSSEEELAREWLSHESCGCLNDYPFMAKYIDFKKVFEEANRELYIEQDSSGKLNAFFTVFSDPYWLNLDLCEEDED